MNHLRTLALILFTLTACERAPAPQAPSTPQPVPNSEPLQQAAPISEIQPAPEVAPEPPPGTQQPLFNRYLASRADEERRNAIDELRRLPAREAVPTIGRLLTRENRAELRILLLDSLDACPGEPQAKLAIVRRELLEHSTTGDVREAALDALLNIQHRDAIPLWRALSVNANEQLLDTARQAITALESLK